MLVSYVLRLVASEATAGRLVGEIEDVRTGLTRPIRGAHELANVVRETQQAGQELVLPEDSPWLGVIPSSD